MKRSALLLVVILTVTLMVSADCFARGGRAGGGRSIGGGGGRSFGGGGRSPSMSRPSMSRPTSRPSVSRPTVSRPTVSRPSYGGGSSRPSIGGSRPSVGGSRPSTLPSGGSRPSVGGSRPSTLPSGGSRPSVGGSRPSTLPSGGSRPSIGGSRPSIGTPNQPSFGSRPSFERPSQGDLQDFLKLPGNNTRPAPRPDIGGDRPTTLPARPDRPNIGDRPTTLPARPDRPNIGDRPTTLPERPDRPDIGDRPTTLPERPDRPDRPEFPNRPDRPDRPDFGNRPDRPVQLPDKIRDDWKHRPNRPFDRNWWNNRWHGSAHWHWHSHWNRYPRYWCWQPCTWVAVGTWLPYTWSDPYYYDYGNTIVYQDNSVYYGDKKVATEEQYYQQANNIAEAVPEDLDPEKVEWMPLGVFAVAQEGVADTGMLMQLAVSKEGVIAGTYFNESTESSRPLEGTVDEKTQRAAWKFVDDSPNQVTFETGIFNLTKEETTCLVHFGPDKTQTWTMIRIPPPEEEAEGGEGAAPASP